MCVINSEYIESPACHFLGRPDWPLLVLHRYGVVQFERGRLLVVVEYRKQIGNSELDE